MFKSLLSVLISLAFASGLWAETLSSSQGALRVEVMGQGFSTPWAIGFLPEGGFLVTERDGRLWRVENGNRSKLSGLPKILVYWNKTPNIDS